MASCSQAGIYTLVWEYYCLLVSVAIVVFCHVGCLGVTSVQEQSDPGLMLYCNFAGQQNQGVSFIFKIESTHDISKSKFSSNYCISKVHEGSKSALLQKLMKFGYIVCVCLR